MLKVRIISEFPSIHFAQYSHILFYCFLTLEAIKFV